MTDACENITLTQLLLRTVKTEQNLCILHGADQTRSPGIARNFCTKRDCDSVSGLLVVSGMRLEKTQVDNPKSGYFNRGSLKSSDFWGEIGIGQFCLAESSNKFFLGVEIDHGKSPIDTASVR